MTAVAVQISLFEHGRTFVQCFTISLCSTNCTQFRKFSQTRFIWSLMNICIVLYSTDCKPYKNIRAVNNWTAVCRCSCTQINESQIKTQANWSVQFSLQHSTDCTPYTNIRAVNNWTAVCICSCTQTPKSAIKTQEMTASPPRLSQCSDRPGSGQSFSTDRSRKTDNIYWIAGCYFPWRCGDIVPRK